MDDKYNYGGRVALVKKAAGVSGVLIKDAAGNFVFRVYGKEGEFTDYDIRDDDLAVTIAEDELAAFYQFDGRFVLDHSPQVLGLEEAVE
ncbi:MAG: hypothetical protein ACE5FQ_11360 [Thiogranum sp.]